MSSFSLWSQRDCFHRDSRHGSPNCTGDFCLVHGKFLEEGVSAFRVREYIISGKTQFIVLRVVSRTMVFSASVVYRNRNQKSSVSASNFSFSLEQPSVPAFLRLQISTEKICYIQGREAFQHSTMQHGEARSGWNSQLHEAEGSHLLRGGSSERWWERIVSLERETFGEPGKHGACRGSGCFLSNKESTCMGVSQYTASLYSLPIPLLIFCRKLFFPMVSHSFVIPVFMISREVDPGWDASVSGWELFFLELHIILEWRCRSRMLEIIKIMCMREGTCRVHVWWNWKNYGKVLSGNVQWSCQLHSLFSSFPSLYLPNEPQLQPLSVYRTILRLPWTLKEEFSGEVLSQRKRTKSPSRRAWTYPLSILGGTLWK